MSTPSFTGWPMPLSSFSMSTPSFDIGLSISLSGFRCPRGGPVSARARWRRFGFHFRASVLPGFRRGSRFASGRCSFRSRGGPFRTRQFPGCSGFMYPGFWFRFGADILAYDVSNQDRPNGKNTRGIRRSSPRPVFVCFAPGGITKRGQCVDRGVEWGRGDSNPHALRHMILSHACLPVPALPRVKELNVRGLR